MKVRGKIKNFWFYYKWHTLIVLFFVIVIAVMAVQHLGREKYDIRILYGGPAIIGEQTSTEITNAFKSVLAEDYNKDGEKKVELYDLIIMNSDELKGAYEKGVSSYFLNENTVADNVELMNFHASVAEYLIYMVDADYYQKLHDNSVFVALDVFGVKGGERYDDCAVYLHSLDFAKLYSVFDVFPQDTLICVKRVQIKDGKSRAEKLQQNHIKFFKALVEFKLPEEFEAQNGEG